MGLTGVGGGKKGNRGDYEPIHYTHAQKCHNSTHYYV